MKTYIEMKPKVSLAGGPVLLGDIAEIWAPSDLKSELYRQTVLEEIDGRYSIVSSTDIYRLFTNTDFTVTGSTYTVVERLESTRSSSLLLCLVWLLLFTGSALTIMYFHEDVSMAETQLVIVNMLGGAHPNWFHIPYSAGIGLGMLLFFNRLLKKQFNDEPSPLDIEIYKYEKSVEDYVTTTDQKK
ncbi:stage V sporulation protein AA [Jeotgalibacillus sp. JSM ZJ347]|uniref:stage V sporulation protein AA n=1 Tax=Jeotgalibacillus sp. JSM ZJ347 TaxID=3342117 RepID=UPI0035A8C2F4